MKKLSVILLFAVAAFLFTGCSEDEGTGLRWKNDDDSIATTYDEIQWVKFGDTTSFDQSWNGVPDSSSLFTDYKEVNALYGEGYVLAGAIPAQIILDNSDSDWENATSQGGGAILVENTDVTLVIGGAKKK